MTQKRIEAGREALNTVAQELAVSFSSDLSGLSGVLHLLGGSLFVVDAAVGKAAKATIRVEVDVVGRKGLQRIFHFVHDELDTLWFFGAGVDCAQSDFTLGETISYNFDISGSWCGVFQDKLVHVHGSERIHKRSIVSSEEYIFASTPVAATDMDTCADSINAFDDLIQEGYSVSKFGTLITAGC